MPISETTFIKQNQNEDTLKKSVFICIYTAVLKSEQANSTIMSMWKDFLVHVNKNTKNKHNYDGKINQCNKTWEVSDITSNTLLNKVYV